MPLFKLHRTEVLYKISKTNRPLNKIFKNTALISSAQYEKNSMNSDFPLYKFKYIIQINFCEHDSVCAYDTCTPKSISMKKIPQESIRKTNKQTNNMDQTINYVLLYNAPQGPSHDMLKGMDDFPLSLTQMTDFTTTLHNSIFRDSQTSDQMNNFSPAFLEFFSQMQPI